MELDAHCFCNSSTLTINWKVVNMVHVFLYGMPRMGPKKHLVCSEAIREAVAKHAMTGGSHNVLTFFVPAQQTHDAIVAYVHGLEEGCHVVPTKDERDELCHAVAVVIVAHRPRSKRCSRRVEVYTLARDPEMEGQSIYCR